MAKERQLTRRSFLATTALTAGALATAGAAGCSSVDTSGEAAQEAAPAVEEEFHYNTCRGNCGGNCTLKGTVREGKIVKMMPREELAQYEGLREGCVRGLSGVLRLYNTRRLLHPMIQRGERGSDNWEQISWDEAFALIAEKFQTAIDTHGPRSVALWRGWGGSYTYLNGMSSGLCARYGSLGSGLGGARFAKKTGATVLSNNGDMAGIYMIYLVLSIPQASIESIQYTKTFISWGSNFADAGNNRNAWYWLCRARENGAKVITVDPLYSATAAVSDMWLPIRPGTDTALMLAMVNHLVDNGMENVEYLKNKSVAPLLVKEDGTYLRASEIGKAEAGSEGDVPMVWDEGVQGPVAHTEATAPALSGSFDAEGVSVRTVWDATLESIKPFDVAYAAEECGIEASQIEELARICVENGPTMLSVGWGIEHTYNSFRVYYAMGLLGSVIGQTGQPGAGWIAPQQPASSLYQAPISTNKQAFEIEDAIPNTFITGEWLIDIMETGKWNGEDFPVDCLYIFGCNPLDNLCDPNGMVKAWEKIDFVVTAEQFMTTTAHYSDLILPVSQSWESHDWVSGKPHMMVKAVEPAGECKPDIDIFRGIASAMGYTDLYTMTDEEYLRELLDTPENIEAGLGYDTWAEKEIVEGEYKYAENPSVEYNALGRTQFYVEQFLANDEQGDVFPREDCMPFYTQPAEAYHNNPDRAKYPLFGFSNHNNYHSQSLFGDNAWLDMFRKYEGDPYCIIHEDVAVERGIVTGDVVKAYNDHGHVVLRAVVSKGVQKECVWFPHGFYWDEFIDGYAQSLTGHHVDPQTSNANFNDFILQVEKYEGGAQ